MKIEFAAWIDSAVYAEYNGEVSCINNNHKPRYDHLYVLGFNLSITRKQTCLINFYITLYMSEHP